jgi:NADPH-dependent 2,4-dienoyl-CoA reductase/sulfur reductase-like enzyme
MTNRRILVVGGTAAGPSAAAKAARTNPRAEIVLFEAGETVSYGLCEVPYAISGLIEREERLVSYTPERLRQDKGVEVRTLHRVEAIIPSKHAIVVRDFTRGAIVEERYDKLIMATGSIPRRLNVECDNARNVFRIQSRADTLSILNYVKNESPKRAVIIGGGYIGMEMAEALSTLKMEVSIVHRYRLPMAGLEQETRESVLDELTRNGVQFVTNAKVEALPQSKDGRVTHVVTNRGSFEADIVILSLGVEPNVALAKTANIRIGPTGAIRTDERQQTSVDSIYAAGDCCEVRNLVTGKPMYLPLATTASRGGWVAGENAAGGRAVFKGAIRAVAVKVFGLEVAQVGISSEEARDAGFSVAVQSVNAYDRAGIMPGSGKLTIKLILDQRSGRLLGANVFGGAGAVLRANTLGVAIQHHLTVDGISRFDLIYSPPFAPLWDPILVAANQAKKRTER